MIKNKANGNRILVLRTLLELIKLFMSFQEKTPHQMRGFEISMLIYFNLNTQLASCF